jgi:hypothetical protein
VIARAGAVAFVLAARRLRGRSSLLDLVFPLLWLSWARPQLPPGAADLPDLRHDARLHGAAGRHLARGPALGGARARRRRVQRVDAAVRRLRAVPVTGLAPVARRHGHRARCARDASPLSAAAAGSRSAGAPRAGWR